MKQYLFLATAIATASLFTGCSNNEYVGDQPEALNGTDGAIVFSMGKANTTRTELSAPKSAEKLGNTFYVYGTKGDTPTDVFRNYKVKYESDNTGKTSDNFKGWEYVGNYLERNNPTPNIGIGENNKQTIKYWDYNANCYEFLAFSAADGDLSDGKIKVAKDQGDKAYTVDIKTGADIEKLYFADYVKIEKPTTPPVTAIPSAEGKYGGYVKFTFRNLAAKVRVGFYETVPGYKIKITKMYADAPENEGKFFAECPNTVASQDSKITVTYITTEGETKNRAYVSEKQDAEGNSALSAANTLTLGSGVFADPLATTSSSPTWDNNGKYTFFWPQEASNPLKIKVDYTLTSVDKDGSNPADKPEEIHVTGATATIPAAYVAWKANTAYTYIFKISDNTNGTTGGTGDPAGLYPITFDAVVEDYANEGSITTVSTPSVTASQDGVTFVDPSVPNSGIKFVTNKDIFLKVMSGDNEVTAVTIKSAYVASYSYDKSPDQNRDAAAWENVNYDNTNKYYKLNQQATNGWWILEVKESNDSGAATTYVIIRVGNAEEGPANP